ncbi:histidine phosphatase superfamily [Leucosporidium creatinivorum]|uniref:Histidine phosphatase superfamily n=1 Tax=Leucosporidium creatinivorum TaxID=106004 RepID=A0A1Y2CUK9_9BASI|nr:histidine phosphatase superfamily [Leucosporidium creatinivorum]
MSTSNTNAPLGAVILARHGDRQGFYQDPNGYTASDTAITPLGEVQNYQLGQMLRNLYAADDSPTKISGLSNTTLVPSQINSTADGGGEGGVIFDSAVALWQGFYPPNLSISIDTLANGSNITSPLGGYQYLQINTVLPADDVDLESWVNCPVWTNRTNSFYKSAEFLAVEAENKDFLNSLKPIVGNRSIALSNMYNLFDFLNVQSIHNATFAAEVNATGTNALAKARDLANYHEYGAFTDSTLDGIGNIAGRTMLPRVIGSLQDFAADSEVKIAHYHFSYKPFLSLFNMTNVDAGDAFLYPDAMVDYASAVTFELRENMAGTGHDVRFGFRNGSYVAGADFNFTYYPLFGSSSLDTDLDEFVSKLEPYLLPNTTTWCHACNNTVNSGCDVVALADNYQAQAEQLAAKSHFTPIGAGFIGFAVTLVVGLLVLAAMRALGLASFGKRAKPSRDERYPLGQAKGPDSIASSRF